MSDDALLGRSIKTLAWLGDAAFEREARWRVARRGDYPIDRLDAIKAEIVRAESQAKLLGRIEPELEESERDVVRRGVNASVSSSPRGRRSTKDYRRATGFEALVAVWSLRGAGGEDRFASLVGPPLEEAIDDAVARLATRPRRG